MKPKYPLDCLLVLQPKFSPFELPGYSIEPVAKIDKRLSGEIVYLQDCEEGWWHHPLFPGVYIPRGYEPNQASQVAIALQSTEAAQIDELTHHQY